MLCTRRASGEGHERHRHRSDEGGAGDPQLAGDVEPTDPLRGPGAGDENHERHPERRSGRDTQHERVGQRVAEDRLHLRSAQPEGGSGEAGRDRARDAHLADDVERTFGGLLGPQQRVEDLGRD